MIRNFISWGSSFANGALQVHKRAFVNKVKLHFFLILKFLLGSAAEQALNRGNHARFCVLESIIVQKTPSIASFAFKLIACQNPHDNSLAVCVRVCICFSAVRAGQILPFGSTLRSPLFDATLMVKFCATRALVEVVYHGVANRTNEIVGSRKG